ncbi:TPA: hypothetical protein ACH3X2_002286 [Trebouxia sp. C0005]
MMEVLIEPGLSPNNGLENAPPSDQSMASNPRKRQAKRSGAKTTSHDGKAGPVMTHHTTGIRINAGLSLPSPTARVASILGVGKASQLLRGVRLVSPRELSTLRQMMEVPNEPGLSPNNGLENPSLSDQSMASNARKGQAM